jgi:hypothetical protein
MKVGDLVRIKGFNSPRAHMNTGKIGIVVYCGTWSIDVRIFENNSCPRFDKKDCEVISESR